MSKAIIIAGFATVGKIILGKKYKNVIDLESTCYKHINMNEDISVEERKGTKRDINPMWPQNYYDAIIKASDEYDIVFVQLKPEHFDYFDTHGIKYSIAYPNVNNWNEIEKRCIERGNNVKFITRLKEVLIPYYEDAIKRNYEHLFILNDSETLEDVLLKMNIKLIDKDDKFWQLENNTYNYLK